MKSVIMIAYHFPPEGNAGVYRPLRFVRNLPKFGWRPTVISLATTYYERYDANLLPMVSVETRIVRVPNRDPWQRFQNWRAMRMKQTLAEAPVQEVRRVNAVHQKPVRSSLREMVRNAEAWFYHPDTAMGWIRPAVKATLQACIENRPDVLWATAGPVSSFIVARKVSESTGIPYVLDFRDAWTLTYNDFEERRSSWSKRLAERSMYGLLERAQSVVFRYHAEAECYCRAYKNALDPTKIHIIPNGFEGSVSEFVPPQKERCEILYTGTVSDYRYDSLLQALAAFEQSSPELANRLHFHFVGEGTDAVGTAAAGLGLTGIVTTEGPSSHGEVTRLTKQYHALLVLGRSSGMRGYELFAGAKLFGYLKTGLPIIGILPSDETKNVLLRVGVTTIANVDREDEIIAMLRKVLEYWSQGKLHSLLPERHACESYSAEGQTEELVRALEGRTATKSFIPGVAEIPPSLRDEISNKIRRLGLNNLSARFTM
jgi:hypothetical protein